MTYKVYSFGVIRSLSTTPNFDDALALLFPVLMNSASHGHIECCETGEVLISVENGQTTYIEESILHKMVKDLFEYALELMGQACHMPANYFD